MQAPVGAPDGHPALLTSAPALLSWSLRVGGHGNGVGMKRETRATGGLIGVSLLIASCCIGPTLVLLFGVSIGALGTLKEIAVIAQYALMLPIAVALHRTVRTTRPGASAAPLATGLGGMVGVVVLQALLVTGVLPFETQVGLVITAFMVVLATSE